MTPCSKARWYYEGADVVLETLEVFLLAAHAEVEAYCGHAQQLHAPFWKYACVR